MSSPISIEANSKLPFPDKKRIELMCRGCEDLINWLNDLIRTGIASIPSYEISYWESISKNLVDCKLSGLSNKVKRLSAMPSSNDEWEEQAMHSISDLYMLSSALLNLSKFDKLDQLNFLNIAGFNITKRHLADSKVFEDIWRILQVNEYTEERIRVRKTWIQGVNSKFMGLLLEYAWGRQDFMINWKPGKQFKGEMKIYPSPFPQRLLLVNYKHLEKEFESFAAYPDLESLFTAYSKALAKNPLMAVFPLCLKDIVVQSKEDMVYIVDKTMKAIRCTCDERVKWSLLSVSGGHNIRLFATWDGVSFVPGSAIVGGRFVSL